MSRMGTIKAPPLADQLCFDLYAASRAVTAAYRPVLTELGISAGQGYLLGRPSVRPTDWASWNGRLDVDGLNRHLAGSGQAGEPSVANESH